MLFNMLVFGVLIDLLIDFCFNPLHLLLLLTHFFLVFRDPDPFVMKSFLFLVDCKLLRLLISVHLCLLRSSDFVESNPTLLNKLA